MPEYRFIFIVSYVIADCQKFCVKGWKLIIFTKNHPFLFLTQLLNALFKAATYLLYKPFSEENSPKNSRSFFVM